MILRLSKRVSNFVNFDIQSTAKEAQIFQAKQIVPVVVAAAVVEVVVFVVVVDANGVVVCIVEVCIIGVVVDDVCEEVI